MPPPPPLRRSLGRIALQGHQEAVKNVKPQRTVAVEHGPRPPLLVTGTAAARRVDDGGGARASHSCHNYRARKAPRTPRALVGIIPPGFETPSKKPRPKGKTPLRCLPHARLQPLLHTPSPCSSTFCSSVSPGACERLATD